MAARGAQNTIISQIDEAEENIGKCQKRVENLEDSLRRRKFNNGEEKNDAKQQLEEVKKNLARHEAELKTLRGENRRSLVMAVVLLIAIYIIYNFVMFAIKKWT